MITNIYAPNIGAPNIIFQTLLDLKGQISPDQITLGDFNTSFSSIDTLSKLKNEERKLRMEDYRHGSNSRTLALLTGGPMFMSQYREKDRQTDRERRKLRIKQHHRSNGVKHISRIFQQGT
jgi:hypothetical protein